MSPYEIQNEDALVRSTRFLHDWHRSTFGRRAKMIDLDGIGYCPDCFERLYVIEGTSNPEKPVAFVRSIAEALRIPAVLFRHDAAITEVVRVTLLDTQTSGDEEYAKDLFGSFRERHSEICPNRPAGRNGAG